MKIFMKLILNIILVLLLLIAFVPPFRRFMFHLLVGRQLIKQQKKAEDAFRKATTKNNRVHIDPNSKNTPNSSFNGGEYVDYEEIKD